MNAGAADVLSRDCERVDLGFVSEDVTLRPYPISVRRGVARFVVPCSSRSGCRGTIRLRRAAPRAFTSRRRGRITVAVPLPRTGTLVRVNVALTLRGDDGESSRVAYTLRMPR